MNRALEYVLRGFVTLLVGGQLFTGRWYGESIFRSYLKSQNLSLIQGGSEDLYGIWGYASVPSSLLHLSGFGLIIGVAALLLFTGHVLYKRELSTRTPQSNQVQNWKEEVYRSYVRWYHTVSLLLILMLMCIFFVMPLKDGLAVVLIVFALPAALYLLLYSSDMVSGNFRDRFLYTCFLLSLAVAMAGWPARYGREVFDPEFSVVSWNEPSAVANASIDHCGSELQKGPIFLANAKSGNKSPLFLRVCFDHGGRKFIDFFEHSDTYQVTGQQKLTDTLRAFVPPVSSADANQAISDVRNVLGASR